jgi:ElaB/YqjD/DUF883 family membrane-anchored ribosome-binding protein
MANQSGSAASSGGSMQGTAARSSREVETDTLADQVEALKTDLASIRGTLADLAKAGAREGKATANQYVKAGRAQADALLGEAQDLQEEFEAKIAKNPLTSVLIAAFFGYLFGRFR